MVFFIGQSLPFMIFILFLLRFYSKNKEYKRIFFVCLGLNFLGWYLNLTRSLLWPFLNPTDVIARIYQPLMEVVERVLQ